ncbi:MAG TPA: hypothetical protein VM942_00500 [Acidimicrobiales bacterium]|nr:hypothetical protein [Acidimicrobiales bacterium]
MTRLGTRTWRSICFALILSGCGDGGGGDDGGGGSGRGRGGDEAPVEKVFRDYYENLADRDFEAACGKNAPETTDQMLENVRTANIEVSTCEEAFAAIYATGNAAELVEEVVRTTEVEDVTVAGKRPPSRGARRPPASESHCQRPCVVSTVSGSSSTSIEPSVG